MSDLKRMKKVNESLTGSERGEPLRSEGTLRNLNLTTLNPLMVKKSKP